MKKILSILVITTVVGVFAVLAYANLNNSASSASLLQETPKCQKDSLASHKCPHAQANMDSTKYSCKKDTAGCKQANKPCCKDKAECKHDKMNCPAKTSEAKGNSPKAASPTQK